MPTYDYRCKSCGHVLELFQSMSDAPKKKCPSCGQNALERLIGAGAGFLFKGKGFYSTDYRSKGYKDAASKDEGGSSDATEKKSDAKPATNGAAPEKKSEPAKKKTDSSD
jgi:putative FmdB family regulatory protein